MHEIALHYLADRPEHTPTCAGWEHAQWGAAGGKTLDDAMAAYAAARRDGLPLTLIACTTANDIAGMVSLWESDCALRPELAPWVASLFVSPRFRGLGIGTRLFFEIRTNAERLGIRRLYLMTQHSEAVYASLGWETFDRIDGPGAMKNAALMRLDLPRDATPR
jgi:GNAT superfamily N-acetyltransferase